MISIYKLFKYFGRIHVLHDVNLTFRSGDINGIVGRNGAGKTTLFRCLAGLEDHGGQVILENIESKYKIGFLAADPYFMTRITGREYLQLLSNASHSSQVDFDVKNIFNLPLDQYAHTYSTGMKKKLALLGLLIQDNDVLLLDEPFNGVDIQSNTLIIEIIKRLKVTGKTIIVSSHILGALTELCDHIHVLDNGSIARSVDRSDFESLNLDMFDDDFEDKMNRLEL